MNGTDDGWVIDVTLELDQLSAIEAFLEGKKLGNASSRERFISALLRILTNRRMFYVNKLEPSADAVRDKLEAVARASGRLLKAMKDLDEDSAELVRDGYLATRHIGEQDARKRLETLRAELNSIHKASDWARDAIKPTKSGPPAGGPQKQFVHDLACAYRQCFGKALSPARTGQFMDTLNTIIQICDLGTEVGETQAKSVLKRLS